MSASEAQSLIPLEAFSIASIRIFNLFGLKVTRKSRELRLWEVVLKWFSGISFIVILLQIVVFMFINLRTEGIFIALTFDLSVSGFACLSILKVYMIAIRNRNLMFEVFDKLDSLFPKTNHEQSRFEIKKYLDILNVQNGTYIVLTLFLFSFFNFADIIVALYYLIFVDGSYERNFSYFFWFPFGFDGKIPIFFEFYYVVATIGSSFCIFMNMATDLMYCSLLTMLCMEFDCLRKKFEDFDETKTTKDLAQLVNEHYILIRYFA